MWVQGTLFDEVEQEFSEAKGEQGECRICLQDFKRRRGRGQPAVYCSAECRHLSRTVQKLCPVCEEPFFGLPRNGTKFCSHRCSVKSQRNAATKTCLHCEKRFIKKKNPNKGMYCSRDCAFARRKARSRPKPPRCVRVARPPARTNRLGRQVQCETCGSGFIKEQSNQRYCRLECRPTFRPAWIRELCNCLRCGVAFNPLIRRQRYCAKRCSQLAHNKIYRQTERGRARVAEHKRRRQEQLVETEIERINPLDVFERDNWTCWLCRLPVDRTQQHPEPLAPTVDHVIPISRGGPHTMGNVRCAHSRCNLRKSDRLPDSQ